MAATYRSYADYFEHHYQTWGRRLRLVFVTPSGADDDAVRARGDAVRVAAELGAFACGEPLAAGRRDQRAVRRGRPVPVFMTQEATRQGYSPEWVLLGAGGGGLTGADATFSGRTYDRTQWAHAFGLSFSAAWLTPGESEAWRIHAWHTGRPPPARASYGLIYRAQWIFDTGMHLGGPLLTPASIRDGLFRLPPAGQGMLTSPSVSFDRHGLWPADDHGAGDDVTELWWDPSTAGPDEAGGQGVGMYRYVAAGKRYLPGSQPTTETDAFNRTGTVTVYDEPPPSDEAPSYPHRD